MAARLSSEAGGGTVREGGVCQEREAIRMVGENAAQQEPYLKDVVPRLHIGYVDPLTVNVCIVGVIAAWTQALGKGVNTGRILKPLHIPLPPDSRGSLGLPPLCFLPDLGLQWLKPLLSHWMDEPRIRWKCHGQRGYDVKGQVFEDA